MTRQSRAATIAGGRRVQAVSNLRRSVSACVYYMCPVCPKSPSKNGSLENTPDAKHPCTPQPRAREIDANNLDSLDSLDTARRCKHLAAHGGWTEGGHNWTQCRPAPNDRPPRSPARRLNRARVPAATVQM